MASLPHFLKLTFLVSDMLTNLSNLNLLSAVALCLLSILKKMLCLKSENNSLKTCNSDHKTASLPSECVLVFWDVFL